MRFKPELSDGANAGLKLAQDFLEPVKQKHSALTYADLWILASYVAIEEMGGPHIPFVPGRKDACSEKSCPPNGRLPGKNNNKKKTTTIILTIFISRNK